MKTADVLHVHTNAPLRLNEVVAEEVTYEEAEDSVEE
jgi:hypothetical protein